jgi:hypothetical protein
VDGAAIVEATSLCPANRGDGSRIDAGVSKTEGRKKLPFSFYFTGLVIAIQPIRSIIKDIRNT